MKQRITVKQLDELSEKGKKRLRKWWIKHIQEGDLYIDLDDPTMFEVINCCEDELKSKSEMPLFSIGQMIEFLDDSITNGFSIDFTDLTVRYKDMVFPFREGVCDALWGLVKEKLEI